MYLIFEKKGRNFRPFFFTLTPMVFDFLIQLQITSDENRIESVSELKNNYVAIKKQLKTIENH